MKHRPLPACLAAIALLPILGSAVSSAVEKGADADPRLAHRMATLLVRADPGTEVKVEQLSHEFWFGTAMSSRIFTGRFSEEDRKIYLATLKEHFNAIVPENAMKWGSTERRLGRVSYQSADQLVAWAESNGLRIRGHCVFWGVDEFVQPWIRQVDDASLRDAMQERARGLLTRYRGRVDEFDLNNEMLHGHYYAKRLGDPIRKEMFLWAKEANTDACLYVNDFSILSGGALPKYARQIDSLLAEGVPLGGIGLQGHFDKHVDADKVLHTLDTLARFDLPIKITEFDMKTIDEAAKAKGLETLYRTAFAHPAVDGILMWGFWAKLHWRGTTRFGTPGYTALWDDDWTPTPSARTYRRLVFDEWWTQYKGVTNDKGERRIPVFLGKHRLLIDGKETTVEVTTPGEVRMCGQSAQ